MDDSSQSKELEAAYNKVLSHSSFSSYSREELSSCEKFCDIIRQTPHEIVLELLNALEEISYETDNHNESSGFLMTFAALGGGLSQNPVADEGIDIVGGGNFSNLDEARERFPDVPTDDVELFTQWAIDISNNQRSLAFAAAMDALLKRVVLIGDDDYSALLTHHQINTVLYYALTDEKEILEAGNFASENLNVDFDIRKQIPRRLWESFNSRPQREVNRLLKKWWGPRSRTPNDFYIGLEWQREGYIQVHQGKNYSETVAEFVLNCCEPSDVELDQPPRANHGIEAIGLDPFLAEDLYEALSKKEPYKWLISFDISHRAMYLETLFASSVLDRQRILSALDEGIRKNWDRGNISNYKELRDLIST